MIEVQQEGWLPITPLVGKLFWIVSTLKGLQVAIACLRSKTTLRRSDIYHAV